MSESQPNQPHPSPVAKRAPKFRSPLLRHLTGMAMLPAVPFLIVGYRLVGIKAYYDWGAVDVSVTTRPTHNQFFFSRMFILFFFMVVIAILHFGFGMPID